MSEDKILHALLVARDRVMRGWCQGQFTRNRGKKRKVCAEGAIHLGRREMRQAEIYAMGYVAAAIGLPDPTDPADVYHWNDHPERTEDEVFAAYDRAVKNRELDLERGVGPTYYTAAEDDDG